MTKLRIGNRFESSEGIYTIRKRNKRTCLVEWDYHKGKMWNISIADILDQNKSSIVTISNTTYPFANISMRTSKKNANEAFIRASEKKSGLIAYLDADDANTSKTLQIMSPGSKRIAINLHTSTCKSILDLSNGNMFIFRGTMGAFVEQQPPLSTSGVWFDYCGTISGNKLMCPLDDIRTAIRRQIFVRNGGIAAFTFSTRDSKRNTRVLQNDVLKMFIRRYPKSKIVDMFRYHPSMLFFMIRV